MTDEQIRILLKLTSDEAKLLRLKTLYTGNALRSVVKRLTG